MTLDELEIGIKKRLREMQKQYVPEDEYVWQNGYNRGINDAILVIEGWLDKARKAAKGGKE